MIATEANITAQDLVQYFNPPFTVITRSQAGEMLGVTPFAVDRIAKNGILVDGIKHYLHKQPNGGFLYTEVFLLAKTKQKSIETRDLFKKQ